MSTPTFDPEDPKLTAYALGELTDPAERAEVETLLQHSPAAQLALKEIQDLTAALTAEYDQERRAVNEPAEVLTPNIIDLANRLPGHGWWWNRPLLAVAAALLLVATLVPFVLPTFSSGQRRRLRPSDGAGNIVSSAPAVASLPGARTGSPPAELRDNAPVVALEAQAQGAPANAEASQGKVVDLDVVQASLKDAKPVPGGSEFVSNTPHPLLAQTRSEPANGVGVSAKRGLTSLEANADPAWTTLPSNSQAVSEPSVSPSGSLANTDASKQVPALRADEIVAHTLAVGNRRGKEATVSVDRSALLAGNTDAAPLEMTTSNYRQGTQSEGADTVGAADAARPAQAALAAKPMTPRVAKSETSFHRTQTRMAPAEGSGSSPRVAPQAAAPVAPVTPEMMAKAKFYLRADGAAPEVTLYNTPRVSMWPPTPGTAYNTTVYEHLEENPFLSAKENPLSTFSIDVDTASYANVRRFIEGGSLPPPDAVRVEELLNYFPYDYAPPAADLDKPFAVHLEAAACPWMPEHRLVRIGVKGKEIAQDKRPASNLVFLIDVSGSMQPPERLPLIKRAMSMMVEHLTENDHVAIVTYAGNSGLALPATSGDHKDTILAALDRLEAGGSTNGAAGITLAYQVAKEGFIKGGTNRVILATDGDFNVGVTDQGDLVRLIQDEAKGGVFLSALGVGTDNYKDATMQKLADKGNGNYHYIDRIEEARKVLVDQMGGTLVTIAKDVKIQVEFNPTVVSAYRLIGYEKRMLRKEDFNDDRVDAGEIGAGHSVTALYEVVPVGQSTPGASPAVDALRYVAKAIPLPTAASEPVKGEAGAGGASTEMLTVKMRHKAPDGDKSERSYEVPLVDAGQPGDFARASTDFRFAAAVAEFGLVLRDSPYKGAATLGAAAELAQEGKGADAKGYRAEFIELARRAQAIKDGR